MGPVRLFTLLATVLCFCLLTAICLLLQPTFRSLEGETHQSLRAQYTPKRPAIATRHQAAAAEPRKTVLAVVGVQTGFTKQKADIRYNYDLRRQALRSTWFPASPSALDKVEGEFGLVVRFVIGHSSQAWQEEGLAAEEQQHGGFLRLPIQEAYDTLTQKTLTFFSTVVRLYDTEYIVKVDDDVYLRLDRITFAVGQWQGMHADYVGCMKTGDIVTSKEWRWFEPQHVLLGSRSYFAHSWGSIYVLSGRAAEHLAHMQPGSLRFFNNEDVTVGSWMLAFNVTHFDDRRLCEPKCSVSALAVFDMPLCAGLCDPVNQLPALHNRTLCRMPDNRSSPADVPMIRPIFRFWQPHQGFI